MIFLTITTILLFAFSIYTGIRVWFLAGKLADAQEYIEELELTNEYMYGKIMASYEAILNEVITELKEQFDGETQEEK